MPKGSSRRLKKRTAVSASCGLLSFFGRKRMSEKGNTTKCRDARQVLAVTTTRLRAQRLADGGGGAGARVWRAREKPTIRAGPKRSSRLKAGA